MRNKTKVFGAALDVIPSPERVGLKLAYINHQENEPSVFSEFKDPYDYIKAYFEKNRKHHNRIDWAGKILFPSWLTPKPLLRDRSILSPEKLSRFLRNNGCWRGALSVANYIDKKIYPSMPVMIGVDHGLTGGSIMALAERYPDLNVVILDAHFDVMNTEKIDEQNHQDGNAIFSTLNKRKIGYKNRLDYYECGNFLDFLLKKKVIAPKNLWILGVQDEIYRELNEREDLSENLDLNMISIKKWIGTGVHVIFKHEVQSRKFKIDLNGPTYLSIDMDVGSMSSIYSARFMNSYGLNRAEFLQLLHKVSLSIRENNYPLVGLDIMEFDVHFFEAVKEKKIDDRADEIVKEIFRLFINKNGCPYPS